MKKVTAPQVATPDQASRADLPESVQAALGDLAGAAREGLLALSVGVGLGVMHELIAAEVEEVVGPKGRHDSERRVVRHGSEDGQVTPGGRRADQPLEGGARLAVT
jgi:putative transposase